MDIIPSPAGGLDPRILGSSQLASGPSTSSLGQLSGSFPGGSAPSVDIQVEDRMGFGNWRELGLHPRHTAPWASPLTSLYPFPRPHNGSTAALTSQAVGSEKTYAKPPARASVRV